jgi:hypothetical protein
VFLVVTVVTDKIAGDGAAVSELEGKVEWWKLDYRAVVGG